MFIGAECRFLINVQMFGNLFIFKGNIQRTAHFFVIYSILFDFMVLLTGMVYMNKHCCRYIYHVESLGK